MIYSELSVFIYNPKAFTGSTLKPSCCAEGKVSSPEFSLDYCRLKDHLWLQVRYTRSWIPELSGLGSVSLFLCLSVCLSDCIFFSPSLWILWDPSLASAFHRSFLTTLYLCRVLRESFCSMCFSFHQKPQSLLTLFLCRISHWIHLPNFCFYSFLDPFLH